MSGWKEDLLIELLDCGYADLDVIADCEYDMCDVVQECKAQFGRITLNGLARTMFDFGRADIEDKRLSLIDDLEAEKEDWDKAIERGQELTEEEQERYDALESDIDLLKEFDVYENLESFHNYLDTHIWVTGTSDGGRIHELLKDAFEEFRDNTGYEIR